MMRVNSTLWRVFASVALLLLELSDAAPSVTYTLSGDAQFAVSFFPSWSLEASDCFTSSCPQDQTFNFYLNELLEDSPYSSICDVAASLGANTTSNSLCSF
jgi:hypothetical protein